MAEAESAQVRAADEPRQAGAEERAAGPLAEAISMMARLRAPGGCPWRPRAEFDTIKRYTLEETYEVFDAIERRAWPELKDELGDLLLQVCSMRRWRRRRPLRHCGRCGKSECEAGAAASACVSVEGKLADATDPEAVLRNWEQIKRGEKLAAAAGKKTASAMDAIPRSMPATMEARKLGSKAAKAGFDWPDVEGLFEKLQEEIAELKVELGKSLKNVPQGLKPDSLGRTVGTAEAVPLSETNVSATSEEVGTARAAIEEELGDLLFTVVNLARHLKVDAESARARRMRSFARASERWRRARAASTRWLRSLPLNWMRCGTARNAETMLCRMG